MSTLSQFSGGGIKSIQRGIISNNFNTFSDGVATISAVNTAKTMLNYLGMKIPNDSAALNSNYIRLTSSTQVTLSGPFTGSNVTYSVSYEVIEYF